MGKGRIEAFSDGVIAIIITIMVLELRPPEGEDWRAIFDLWPVFLSDVLSFVNVGIYWSNHHHMISRVTRVDGRILWLNLHLLFWLSLMPFATAVMGEGAYSLLVHAFRALRGRRAISPQQWAAISKASARCSAMPPVSACPSSPPHSVSPSMPA